MGNGSRYLVAVALALLPGAAGPAHGGTTVDPDEPATPKRSGWRHQRRALEDPRGVRAGLETSGIALQGAANQFFGWRLRGGAGAGEELGASGSYDLFAQLDLEELARRPGVQILAHLKGAYDENLNGEVGALGDPVDDADFDEALYVSELWAEQSLWRDRAGLRLGFLEQQTVFDRNVFANSEDRQFASTRLDNSPIVPLPNALGVAAWVRPAPWLELAVGVSDADNEPRHAGFHTAFDGMESWTEILEATIRVVWSGTLSGHYRIGGFRDGANRTVFGRIDPSTGRALRRRGHYGWYLSADQWIFREAGSRDAAPQGLGLFGRLGFADEETNAIDTFVSLGAVYQGPIPGRDADVVGVGWAYAGLSDRYSAARPGTFRRENSVELYYRIAIFPWLLVTPHLEYIASPSGEKSARDAVVALLRLRMVL